MQNKMQHTLNSSLEGIRKRKHPTLHPRTRKIGNVFKYWYSCLSEKEALQFPPSSCCQKKCQIIHKCSSESAGRNMVAWMWEQNRKHRRFFHHVWQMFNLGLLHFPSISSVPLLLLFVGMLKCFWVGCDCLLFLISSFPPLSFSFQGPMRAQLFY